MKLAAILNEKDSSYFDEVGFVDNNGRHLPRKGGSHFRTLLNIFKLKPDDDEADDVFYKIYKNGWVRVTVDVGSDINFEFAKKHVTKKAIVGMRKMVATSKDIDSVYEEYVTIGREKTTYKKFSRKDWLEKNR